MKHYGDITKINGAAVPPVNIITGGSPCQDLSVAGKRAGLAGERSGLFMEQIRIIREMREHDRAEKTSGASAGDRGTNINLRLRPRYMVWENVPGAFSSNGGEDFRAVLEEIAKIAKSDVFIPRPSGGRWTHAGAILGRGDDGTPFSIAWRLHDAQYWGVPQRRKRIALVGDFGGWSATKILFNSESLPGDPEPSETERERASRDPKDCAGETGTDDGLSFQERAGKQGGGKGILIQRGAVGALRKTYLNRVCVPERDPEQIFDARGNGDGKTAPTITGDHERRVTDYTGVVFACAWDGTQTSPTITTKNAGGNQRMPDKQNFNAVLTYGLDRVAYNQGQNAQFDFSIDEEKIGAMTSRGPGEVGVRSIVRRLTPMECERLQGYHDHWTDIGDWIDSKGKKHKGDSDAPRYKALGNSIALPFWDWLAERIIGELKAEGEEDPTMASLFDGIGGFPLVFSNHGCRPIWASEIEEFPIAVTKIRFPEEQEEEEGNE